MLYEFLSGHNTAKATKTFVVRKIKGAVDPITKTRSLNKFRLGGNNYDDLIKSCRFKTVDSEAVYKAIEANYVFNFPLFHNKDWTQGWFMSGFLHVLNTKLFFFKIGCHTIIKVSSLFYYFLLIAGGRIFEYMPFPRELALS